MRQLGFKIFTGLNVVIYKAAACTEWKGKSLRISNQNQSHNSIYSHKYMKSVHKIRNLKPFWVYQKYIGDV